MKKLASIATTLAILAAISTSNANAQASKAMQDLATAAAKKGPVVWTESSPEGAMRAVIAAFNKDYPAIKVQFVRNTGGNTLAARVIQEAQAGRPTASLATGDKRQFEIMRQRGLVVERDWSALGVSKIMSPRPHLVATAAAIGVLVWNKSKVKDADAPKNYNDLVNPKWSGKVGTWLRAPTYTNLAKAEGDAKVTEFLTKLVANKPRGYKSTFQLGQDVGTGEIDVGFSLYHTTLVPIKKGAPIGFAFMEPTPLDTIWSTVINKGANPEGAQVLVAWLASDNGAKAYEAATLRGNPYAPATETAKLVGKRKLTEWTLDEATEYDRLQTKYNKILSGAAK